jgi:hypothetical protein
MAAFRSISLQPPTGVPDDASSVALRLSPWNFSQGTIVYGLGAGVALGSPDGPKTLTLARAVFKAQIHLFRRLAKLPFDVYKGKR